MKILLFANTSWFLHHYRGNFARFLKHQDWEVVLLCPDDEYTAFFEKEGFRCVFLEMQQHGTNLKNEFQTLQQIYRIYKKERPDIAHHFTIKPILYGSFSAWLLGIRNTINTISGLGYVFSESFQKSRLLKTVILQAYRFMLHRGITIFLNHQDQEYFLSRNLVRKEQAKLIMGDGIDTQYFEELPEPAGTPAVLMACRMLRDKGVYEFVSAARTLKDQGPPVRMLLAGKIDPTYPDTISESELLTWQAEGLIEWLGWQSKMKEILKDVNIACLLSHEREGIPRGLLEASSMQRAVIATDVPGCQDVVIQQMNGLLVPPKDAAAFADAVKYLVEHPLERRKMGERGRRFVEENFSDGLINNQTLEIYQRLISAGK